MATWGVLGLLCVTLLASERAVTSRQRSAKEGSIMMRLVRGPTVTYRTGESFSEMPGDRHAASENACRTAPAKLLAVFVVDRARRS